MRILNKVLYIVKGIRLNKIFCMKCYLGKKQEIVFSHKMEHEAGMSRWHSYLDRVLNQNNIFRRANPTDLWNDRKYVFFFA